MRAAFPNPHSRYIILALVAICLVFSGVNYVTSRSVAHLQDIAGENHDLICRLDLLFGLDRPLPRNELEKLRASQRAALRQIIAACPELHH